MDIVMFIKNVRPPFDGVLDQFVKILLSVRDNDQKCPIKNMRKTRYSLQFNYRGYEFDLLPATDFVPEPNTGSHQQVTFQQRRTLNEMAKKRNKYCYSSSLAFSVIDFMKQQSSFVHDIVRLAKLWYKGACITTYISGAKYAIELIAVEAANYVEDEKQAYPYVAALRRFLETIEDFESMDIVFDYTYEQISRKHWPPENVDYVRLIDPVNPYNNLVDGFFANADVIQELQGVAAFTIEQLQLHYDKRESDYKYVLDLLYPALFDIVSNGAMRCKITDDFESGLEPPRAYNNITIRKPNIDKFSRVQLDFMYIYLAGLCEQLAYDYNWDESSVEDFTDTVFEDLRYYNIFEDAILNEDYVCADFDVSIWLDAPSGKFRLSFDLKDQLESESDESVAEPQYSDSSSDYWLVRSPLQCRSMKDSKEALMSSLSTEQKKWLRK